MSKLILLLLLLTSGSVLAQEGRAYDKLNPRHRTSVKTGEKHENNKATFRKLRHPLNIDTHIHDPTQFKTAKGNRQYTMGKKGKNRKSNTPGQAKIKVGKVAVGRRSSNSSRN